MFFESGILSQKSKTRLQFVSSCGCHEETRSFIFVFKVALIFFCNSSPSSDFYVYTYSHSHVACLHAASVVA